jgi:hypothetical protein
MAQKRTDYSKFTQPNGTIQVLMLWASVALHLAIGSNLGLFGRLDPIKVKPAGGTVRVVDLTPAEQTRVPESAKARPLPIAPTPVNPETATRAPLSSNSGVRSGASNFVPPRVNRPQLPSPSSQIPQSPTVRQSSPTPVPSTPAISRAPNGADIPVPRPPRPSKPDSESINSPVEGNSGALGGQRKPKKSNVEESIQSSSSGKPDISPSQKTKPNDSLEQPLKTPPSKNLGEGNSTTEEKKKNQDFISSLKKFGTVFLKIDVPAELQASSFCKNYKDVEMIWLIDSSGNLIPDKEYFLPDDKLIEKLKNAGRSVAQSTHSRMNSSQKQRLVEQYIKDQENYAYFPFRLPTC